MYWLLYLATNKLRAGLQRLTGRFAAVLWTVLLAAVLRAGLQRFYGPVCSLMSAKHSPFYRLIA
jgi:hypothetical protein